MPQEQYIQSVIMRKDDIPESYTPLFNDEDCDKEYDVRCRVKLMQIIKSVQNSVHNRHDYVFKIVSVNSVEEV